MFGPPTGVMAFGLRKYRWVIRVIGTKPKALIRIYVRSCRDPAIFHRSTLDLIGIAERSALVFFIRVEDSQNGWREHEVGDEGECNRGGDESAKARDTIDLC